MSLRAMRMIPERRAGVTAWLLLMLAVLCRCSASDQGTEELPHVTVLINVEGVTPDLHALHVRSTLNGVSAKNEQDIVSNLSAFVAYLPPGSRGTATFEVSGVTTNLCQTATGMVSGLLPEEAPYRLDLTVRLSPTATTTCPLTIEVTGQGSVTSEPPGVVCDQAGACRISVLQGSRVTLSAAPGPRSYDFAWGPPCTGVATCSVTVNEETRVPLTFGARGCTDGWCWYNGIPQGNSLRAMWGASPKDLWIVGAYGSLLHYDGRSYSVSPQSGVLTRNDLYGIWGTATNNIWAVGDSGTILHYDGAAWSVVSSSVTSNLRALWGADANDIWAVGELGTIVHYNGTAWAKSPQSGLLTMGLLYRLWGSSANSVWVVGSNGSILHYNGTAWALSPQSGMLTTNQLRGIWGSAANNVWVVGDGGVILNYDGTRWAASPQSRMVTTSALYFLFGAAAGDLWAVGASGTLLHYEVPGLRDVGVPASW